MQDIQIDGTYTYINNIKLLKIGEIIKLIPNPSNRLNAYAIGAYTLNGKKIGYVPFTSSQIDINGKYLISKIKLSQLNPILLISKEFDISNFIHCEPYIITYLKNKNFKYIETPLDLTNDLKKFAKHLQKSGNDITNIDVCEFDDYFTTICIETHDSSNIFYTVTKQYYDLNIFKYDEFFKFGLITKCIYQQFQIHRLEKYIEINYKLLPNKKKINLIKSICLNIGVFKQIKTNELIVIDNQIIKLIKISDYTQDFIKLLVQYLVNHNLKSEHLIKLFNPNNLLKLLNKNEISLNSFNANYLLQMFPNIKIGGICYNHKLKLYCTIDLYDIDNIIEICDIQEINYTLLINLLIKLIISDKQIINVYNPIIGILYQLEISNEIKQNIINIISK
jgi:hypothetical protein